MYGIMSLHYYIPGYYICNNDLTRVANIVCNAVRTSGELVCIKLHIAGYNHSMFCRNETSSNVAAPSKITTTMGTRQSACTLKQTNGNKVVRKNRGTKCRANARKPAVSLTASRASTAFVGNCTAKPSGAPSYARRCSISALASFS